MLLCQRAHQTASPTRLPCSVWVREGTVRDLVGNANRVRPSLTVKYRPSSSGLQAGAVVANVFFAGSLALCTAASYVHSALLPFAHGVLGEWADAQLPVLWGMQGGGQSSRRHRGCCGGGGGGRGQRARLASCRQRIKRHPLPMPGAVQAAARWA